MNLNGDNISCKREYNLCNSQCTNRTSTLFDREDDQPLLLVKNQNNDETQNNSTTGNQSSPESKQLNKNGTNLQQNYTDSNAVLNRLSQIIMRNRKTTLTR